MALDRRWLDLAANRRVVVRALKMAAIVGVILIAINHGDAILHGDLPPNRIARMALTFFVPYAVSTISSVAAMRERDTAGDPPR